jgi:DNA-binding MarR family transcriptional regulator
MRHERINKKGREAVERKAKSYHPLESIGYLLNVAARLSTINLSRHIDQLGLSPAQLPLIFWLLEDENLTQAELCERTHIEQPSVAVALAKMEEKGLIVRQRDKTDKRKYKIYLSDKMKTAAKEIHRQALQSNHEILSAISLEECRLLYTTIMKIIENLEKLNKTEEGKSSKG